MLYLSEAFPERLGGFRVDRLGEVCTVGEWLEVPGLRPLLPTKRAHPGAGDADAVGAASAGALRGQPHGGAAGGPRR